MTYLLHIAVPVLLAQERKERLERVMNKALDWANYMPGNYLVYTSSAADTWFQRLKPLFNDKEHFLVVEIDVSHRRGWLPRWVWDWIHEHE